MRTQLKDYGFTYDRIPIYCDSKSAIVISCNPVQHTKMKHIDVRLNFIREVLEDDKFLIKKDSHWRKPNRYIDEGITNWEVQALLRLGECSHRVRPLGAKMAWRIWFLVFGVRRWRIVNVTLNCCRSEWTMTWPDTNKHDLNWNFKGISVWSRRRVVRVLDCTLGLQTCE